MATRNPAIQSRSQQQRNWGNYASLVECPNGALSTATLSDLGPLEEGDQAYVTSLGSVECSSAGTPGALDAVWVAVADAYPYQRFQLMLGGVS